ncbi:MAG TPA: hypothetical protein VFW86_06815, partial [Candidatus Limnocylindrales bacterium]|nr:hypothetical protein [Candidatus Limnocylindrales bacterium]
MPLEFLKRRDKKGPPVAAPAAEPEELEAQEYALRLYYQAKASEGVRMSAGPQALRELPGMLLGLTENEIEVIEPLAIEFQEASPAIQRPSEALQWLNAHHDHSPVARHALLVLESVGAVDLAYDTFAVTLLHGEVDTSGFPEY